MVANVAVAVQITTRYFKKLKLKLTFFCVCSLPSPKKTCRTQSRERDWKQVDRNIMAERKICVDDKNVCRELIQVDGVKNLFWRCFAYCRHTVDVSKP